MNEDVVSWPGLPLGVAPHWPVGCAVSFRFVPCVMFLQDPVVIWPLSFWQLPFPDDHETVEEQPGLETVHAEHAQDPLLACGFETSACVVKLFGQLMPVESRVQLCGNDATHAPAGDVQFAGGPLSGSGALSPIPPSLGPESAAAPSGGASALASAPIAASSHAPWHVPIPSRPLTSAQPVAPATKSNVDARAMRRITPS